MRPPVAGVKLTGVQKTRYLDDLAEAFPSSQLPAVLLRKLNCFLDEVTALDLSYEIMCLNESRKFGQAWGKLSEALMYKSPSR